MTTPFEDPAVPSGFDFKELQGSLLLFQVIAHEPNIPNVNSTPGQPSPAIRVNMTVLDGPQAGKQYDDALVFPKVLQSQLRSRVGKMVLGRLGQGEAKPGQTAPWRLEAATEADKQRASAALSATSTSSAGPPHSSSPPVGSEPPF